MPHESGEESRVIIITNVILTIFHNITFVELCRERIKYASGSWMNLVRTPTLREENQIYSQGTAQQNKLTVTKPCTVNSKLMLSYRDLISSRRKGSFLVSDVSSPPLVPSGTVENDRFVYLKGRYWSRWLLFSNRTTLVTVPWMILFDMLHR